ncbi:MAG: hypothetical protein ABW154_02550 [Dyella sp.]
MLQLQHACMVWRDVFLLEQSTKAAHHRLLIDPLTKGCLGDAYNLPSRQCDAPRTRDNAMLFDGARSV